MATLVNGYTLESGADLSGADLNGTRLSEAALLADKASKQS